MGKKRNPGVVIVGSFLCVAVIGILLLSLPLMTTDGQGLGFSDAAFMAVSGSCIIGLTVIDVSADLTFSGSAGAFDFDSNWRRRLYDFSYSSICCTGYSDGL